MDYGVPFERWHPSLVIIRELKSMACGDRPYEGFAPHTWQKLLLVSVAHLIEALYKAYPLPINEDGEG